MDYELCKKLKEAGFQQKINPEAPPWFNKFMEETVINTPTLSELIEACGDGLQELSRAVHSAWGTNPRHTDCDAFDYQTEGETPSEAVANLWLELQKNK